MRAALGLFPAFEAELRATVDAILTKDLSDELQLMALVMALERVHARAVAMAVHIEILPGDDADVVGGTKLFEANRNRFWKHAYDEALAEFDKKGLFPPPGETG